MTEENKSPDSGLRLLALEWAVKSCGTGSGADNILDAAKKYLDFVAPGEGSKS